MSLISVHPLRNCHSRKSNRFWNMIQIWKHHPIQENQYLNAFTTMNQAPSAISNFFIRHHNSTKMSIDKRTEKEMNGIETSGCQWACSLVVSTFFGISSNGSINEKPCLWFQERKNDEESSSKTRNNKILFQTLPKFNSIQWPHSKALEPESKKRQLIFEFHV